MKLLMTVWRPANVTKQVPARYHQPDLLYGSKFKPVGVKGGIAGALQQPVEYLGRYAWENYGGVEKTRALAWKAQKEVPIWFKKEIVNTFWFKKYYAKKKDVYETSYDESSYRKLQTPKKRKYNVYWHKRQQPDERLGRRRTWRTSYTPKCTCRKQGVQHKSKYKFYTPSWKWNRYS